MTDRQKVAYMYKYVMQVSDQLQNALNQRHANIYRWQYDEVDCLEEIILLAKIKFFAQLERDLLNILTDQWIPAGSKAMRNGWNAGRNDDIMRKRKGEDLSGIGPERE